MKNSFLLFFCFILTPSIVLAEQIQYGNNSLGQYVPISVGNRNINYGYNANGDYVPTSITNPRDYMDITNIEYGYNANGEYVPTRTYNPYQNEY